MEHAISILIVEDEDIWVQSLRMILTGLGYSIIKTVSNAPDALEAFSTCDYDIILMDIHLNGKATGIELGKIVNSMYGKPFIFMTAGSTHTLQQAAQAQPSAYLTKPVNASSLFIAIQNAIDNFSNKQPASIDVQKDATFGSFFVKQGNRFKKIDWKDVAYLSAGKNYISVFNALDQTEYFIRSSLQKTMKHIIPQALQSQFIQINRSDVVQFSFIQEVANDEVKTAYKSLPLSESFSKDLKNRLNIIS